MDLSNDTSGSRLKRKSAIIEREFDMAVTVRDIQEKLRLSVVYGDDSLLSKEITTADISRPGLEMTGYFDYYTPERIQLVGMKEWSYLVKMSSHNRHQVLRKMFQPETPVIIVARNLEIPEEMLRAAEEKQLARERLNQINEHNSKANAEYRFAIALARETKIEYKKVELLEQKNPEKSKVVVIHRRTPKIKSE